MDNAQPDNPAAVAKKPASGWRRARLLLPALLCLSGACAPGPKTWRAETQMMVLTPAPPALGDLPGVIPSGADESMETQVALIQNGEMARRTLAEMKNAALMTHEMDDFEILTPGDIQKAVTVSNLPGTRLLVVTAEANNPRQAKNLANAVARAFIGYKRNLATNDMISAQNSLERQAARAAQAMNQAERLEREFKQTASSPPDSANRLRQNTEIATELYKRLETALVATRLQRDLVRGDVTIAEYAEAPTSPSPP